MSHIRFACINKSATLKTYLTLPEAERSEVLRREQKKRDAVKPGCEDGKNRFLKKVVCRGLVRVYLPGDSIEELAFSVRTFLCLKRAGINTVGELMQVSEEKLKTIRNLGKQGFREVMRRRSKIGLSRDPEEEDDESDPEE